MAALLIVSLFLPWVISGLGDGVQTYRGVGLPAVVALVSVVSVVALVGGLRHALARGESSLAAVMVAFTFCAAGCGAMLVLVEIVAALLPTDRLPVLASRLTVRVRAGDGLWLATVAAIAGATLLRPAAVAERLSQPLIRALSWRTALRLDLVVFGLGVALVAAAAQLRYATWISVDATYDAFELPGWALPWLGPMTLFGLLGSVAALALRALRPTGLEGLLAAASGWILTASGALAILFTSSLAKLIDALGLPALQGIDVAGMAPEVSAAPWLMFATGLGIAGVGMSWLWTADGSRS